MAPKLRVLMSSSEAYPPTQPIEVNSSKPTPIKTKNFEGEVSVWIKGYEGDKKSGDGKEYFEKGRDDKTYAIIVKGRFLDDPNGDDVMWGNVFERSIKDSLPWGTAVAVKAVSWIEPTIKHDIYTSKPWALSPMLASMNYLSISSKQPKKAETVYEDCKEIMDVEEAVEEVGDSLGDMNLDDLNPSTSDTAKTSGKEGKGEEEADVEHQDVTRRARKKWFSYQDNRESVTLSKGLWASMEFTNGFIDFNTLSVTFPPPVNFHVPLLRYWDGQPVTYVCRRRTESGKSPVNADGMYFSVAIEIIDEEAKAELRRRQGKSAESSDEDEDDDDEDEDDEDDESEYEDAEDDQDPKDTGKASKDDDDGVD